MDRKLALVLGATGGIGGAVTARLLASGWAIRAMHRNPNTVRDEAVEWVKGDAMDAGDVTAAARGASLIVHAVNPPGYRNWSQLVLPMLDNTVTAARANGARIVLPGTVYNFGPDAFPLIGEDAPQNPTTAKGLIRVELERRLAAAASTGEAKVLIVRAGDFFGPKAANNWFSQGLVKPGARPSTIRNPAKTGVGHQWAYLPDVAKTMVQLLERPDLPPFARFHMDGHWDPDGTQMPAAIARVLGDPAVRIAKLPWWLLRLASPFAATLRELLDMKYLWERPVRLRNDRLLAVLGHEPHTPFDDAVRATLIDMGCLHA